MPGQGVPNKCRVQWFALELLRAACRSCNTQRGAKRQAELAEIAL
jgi:hypothetical protein